MAANNLGTAYIKIAPQMQGIQKSISDGLASIKASSLPGAAAVGTVVAKGVSSAMNLVTSSLDDAIKRVDTLNNFPKIMKNLGINAEDAQASIDKMKKSLDGLPTALQDGATAVQRFTSKNNDISRSTDMFLALNNAILAGGAKLEDQQTALEQLTQAYAKGKPDMMEWRSASVAMSAQLAQVAEKMGFGKNAANALGEALRKGEVSMDDFMDAIISLNKEGINGLASFEEQARDATAGISTSMKNLHNRIVSSLEIIIQAFGSKDISDAINKFSSSFAGIADWIGKNVVPIIKNTIIPALKNLLKVVKGLFEFIAQNKYAQQIIMGVVNAFIAFKTISFVKNTISGIVGALGNVVSAAKNAATGISTFYTSMKTGLGLTDSLKLASLETTGLTSKITGLGSSALTTAGSMSMIGTAGIALGAVALTATAVAAGITMLETASISARTAAREYERQCVNLTTAQKELNKALEREAEFREAAVTALAKQQDSELAYLESKKDVTEAEKEYNRVMADGAATDDERREAKLKLDIATRKSTDAEKAYQEAVSDADHASDEYFFTQTKGIKAANEQILKNEVLSGKYGLVAQQLDQMAKSTFTYIDANGQLATSTEEQAVGMTKIIAQTLSKTSETWSKIRGLVEEEGISYIEATKRIGEESGMNLIDGMGNGVLLYAPLLYDAATDTTQKVKERMDEEAAKAQDTGRKLMQNTANGIDNLLGLPADEAKKATKNAIDGASLVAKDAYNVGKQMTTGAANGVGDTHATGTLWSKARSVILQAVEKMKAAAEVHSPSKVTAEIGKFLSLGLAKGIEDYADEAISAAENMATDTMAAMNENVSLEGNMSRLQPQTDLTSGIRASGGQVIQNNEFYVDSELDVKEVSKRLGWQVATAL